MTRDMTRKQFSAALRRHGLRIEVLWIWSDKHSSGIGIITDRQGKLRRRASLAKALTRFDEMDKRRPT